MKRIIFMILLTLNLYADDDTCTEEQVAKMIKQNISKETIDKVCKKIVLNTEDENQVNDLVEDYMETKPGKKNKKAEIEDTIEKEYFFWRVGMGYFRASETDFSEAMISLGLHYYINGLDEDGLGFGIGYSDSSKEKEETYPQKRYDNKSVLQFEMIYNLALKDSYNLAMALIGGKYEEEVTDENFDTVFSKKDTSIYGAGVYLTFPNVAKNGQGISTYYKVFNTYGNDSDGNTNEQTLHLVGLDFIW